MPFSDFKKHAVYTRALVEDLINTPYNWVKDRVVRPINRCMGWLLVNPRSKLIFRRPGRQRDVSRLTCSRQ
jgi:hypothetical protein